MRTIVFASLSILWLGCPAADHGWTDDDDDDSASGDDDTGDDDTSDDDVGDDDTGVEPGDETDGSISLTYTSTGGAPTHVSFAAMFMDIITPATAGVPLEIPTAEDQCTIVLYEYADMIGGDPGEYTYQTAGTLHLSGNGLSFDIDPQAAGGTVTYLQDIPFAQFTFGADYDVVVPGDEFPGFSATLQMPALLELTEPAGATFQLLDGEFAVEWSGGDGSGTSLMLTTLTQDFQDGGIIYCLPANDGSFAVPANLVAQLPAGTASLLVQQFNWELIDASGRPVYLLAGTAAMATGFRP